MARKERSPEGQARADFIDTWSRYKDVADKIASFRGTKLTSEQFIEWKGLVDDRDAIDEELRKHAVHAKVRRSDGVFLPMCKVFVATYSTQGYGANRYARAKADQIVLRCAGRCYARVFADREHYEVHVEVETEIDVEIARRLPDPPLRDWVKRCWSLGANPRVFNPFLPFDLEEKLGVDLGGRDIQQRQVHGEKEK